MKRLIIGLVVVVAAAGLTVLFRRGETSKLTTQYQESNQVSASAGAQTAARSKAVIREQSPRKAENGAMAEGRTNVASAPPGSTAHKYEPWVQAAIDKDIAEGINAEARAKEATLRALAERLKAGLAPDQTIALLGKPDLTEGFKVEVSGLQGTTSTTWRTNTFENIPLGVEMRFSYWPRVGVPFDGRNGQGYEILLVLFDGQHRLNGWFWSSPDFGFSGGLDTAINAPKWMAGKHEISGPPPEGIIWPARIMQRTNAN